jgi:hypothetical protein
MTCVRCVRRSSGERWYLFGFARPSAVPVRAPHQPLSRAPAHFTHSREERCHRVSQILSAVRGGDGSSSDPDVLSMACGERRQHRTGVSSNAATVVLTYLY